MSNIKSHGYKVFSLGLLSGLAVLIVCSSALARDVEYQSGELLVSIAPGEPTQIQFPGNISGGFRKKLSALSLERKDSDLIIFANEGITDQGEAIIIRLDDGRSYSVRLRRATAESPRDDVVKVLDNRGALVASSSEEEPKYKDKNFDYAPSSQVSGLMRELALAAEFGKKAIPGYRMSERYKGETVLNDGTVQATIDKIFIGPNLWGYVIDARNLLDTTQKINPATFRLDGTRAVSATNWELSARPLNVEQQVSAKDSTKVYVITRAKRSN
jgi:hypothetical protein